MAEDPDNTRAAFDKKWASATEAGEYLTQSNDGDWNRALTIIQEAIIGGCPAALELDQGGQINFVVPSPEFALKFWSSSDRFRWVNALNPSMQRINFSDRPWPWELRAYLSLSDLWEWRHIEDLPTTPRVFLYRAEAVKWGLLPALESLQAVASEESPSPDKQLNDPAVGIQAPAHAQTAPERAEAQSPAESPRVEPGPPSEPASAADVGDLAEVVTTAIEPAATEEDDALLVSEAARRKRGRPTKVTLELELHIFKLLDHHGLPDPNDPNWSSQAVIEEIIQDRAGLEKTQAREHARRLIGTWLAGKAGKSN